jgi:hypothetical protein
MGADIHHKPVVDTQNKKIEQIGIVVRNVHNTAKRYSEIFGIGPWVFFDFNATDVIFQNQPMEDGAYVFRAAMASLGKIQIKLLQPLSGEGTHAAFLEKRGEGVHHISFGVIEDYDAAIPALKERGAVVEQQGVLGGALKYTYLDIEKDLGTNFEFVTPPSADPGITPWGLYEPKGPGLINMEGKEIKQVGIVVYDAEKAAKMYWELLGIGPWMLVDFKQPYVKDCTLHGAKITNEQDFNVRAALADIGDMQIELLEPVSGQSTYMEFLNTCGQGVHHVSFGETPDHDEVVSILQNHRFEIEMDGVLGDAIRFTYMATQKDLGTIFEVVKTDPDIEMTLEPYGIFPPGQ